MRTRPHGFLLLCVCARARARVRRVPAGGRRAVGLPDARLPGRARARRQGGFGVSGLFWLAGVWLLVDTSVLSLRTLPFPGLRLDRVVFTVVRSVERSAGYCPREGKDKAHLLIDGTSAQLGVCRPRVPGVLLFRLYEALGVLGRNTCVILQVKTYRS